MKRREMRKLILKVIEDHKEATDNYTIYLDHMSGNILEAIEKAGMLPPNKESITAKKLLEKHPEYFVDDGYHGIVCRDGWRDYSRKVPRDLQKYLEIVNCGHYSIVTVKDPEPNYEWEPEDA